MDHLLDLVGVGVREVDRRRVALEERGRDLVDGLVGRLRGEDRRDQQLVRVVVPKRAQLLGGARVLVGQAPDDLRRALLRPSRTRHRPNVSRATTTLGAVIETRLLQPVTPADLVAVTRLHDDAEAIDGRASLGEAVWRDLDRPLDPASAGVVAVEAVDGTRTLGFAYVHRSDNETPAHWDLGVVLHPDARRESTAAVALLEGAVEHVAGHGGGLVVLWIFEPDDRDDDAAARAGFHPQRDLLQMRVALPLRETPAWPRGVEVRSFVPGADEAAWLTVNNRAFAGHPEQGGWTAATLARRLAEPWFDPTGFLLAFDADGLAGFCWTKIHPATEGDPELGEILGNGGDPARTAPGGARRRPVPAGAGLGRALVVAGLSSLAERGVRTGMLFVAGDNEPALRLYESLGFTTHRRDRAYERDVAAG